MDADGWDARYRAAVASPEHRLWSSEPHRVVQELVSGLGTGTALDLAAGDGRNTVFLARRGWEVTAVDFSAEAIRVARERTRAAGLTANWVVADVRSYQPAQCFDLVVATYLHLSPKENRAVLSAAARWVAPGGSLLVLGHDRDNLAAGAPGPRDATVLYTRELLESCAGELQVRRSEQLYRDSVLDPERRGDGTATAVDTLLFATRTTTRDA